MSADANKAVTDLSQRLKERAAVQPSSVDINVQGGKLIVRCRVQPDFESEIRTIIREVAHMYQFDVDFQPLPI